MEKVLAFPLIFRRKKSFRGERDAWVSQQTGRLTHVEEDDEGYGQLVREPGDDRGQRTETFWADRTKRGKSYFDAKHVTVPTAGEGQPQKSEFGVVRLEALFTLKPWRGGAEENNNEFGGAGERQEEEPSEAFAAVAFAKVVWGKPGAKDKSLTEFVRYGFEPPDTEQRRRAAEALNKHSIIRLDELGYAAHIGNLSMYGGHRDSQLAYNDYFFSLK